MQQFMSMVNNEKQGNLKITLGSCPQLTPAHLPPPAPPGHRHRLVDLIIDTEIVRLWW